MLGLHWNRSCPAVPLTITVVALSVLSCGSITDVYQRSALVAAPYVPSRTGAPLKRGDIRLQGEVNSTLLGGPFVVEGASDSSPSLWIPRAQFGGAAYFCIRDWLEMGAHGRFAPGQLAKPNIEEAPDFPDGDRGQIWGGGYGIRFNKRLGAEDKGNLSFIGEINVEFMEHATWKSSSYSPYYDPDNVTGGTTQGVKVEQLFLVRPVASLQGGYQFLPFLNLFGVAAVELHERNRLVTVDTYQANDLHSEPDPTTTYPMGILGLGIELKVSKAFADIVAFYPLHGEKDLDFGPAASVLVGATL
jgi:hypothetical protein